MSAGEKATNLAEMAPYMEHNPLRIPFASFPFMHIKPSTILILAALSGLLLTAPAHAQQVVGTVRPDDSGPAQTSAVPQHHAVQKARVTESAQTQKKGNGFIRRMLEPVTELQSQSIRLQEQIVKLEKPIENLQPPMVSLQERVKSVEQQMTQLQTNLTDVKGGISSVHNDISAVHGELSGVHDELSGVRNQISKLEKPIGALHEPVARLDVPVSRLYQPISQLQEPIANLHDEVTGLREQMTELQKPISMLNQPISELSAPLKDIRQPITNLHGELVELKSELTDMRKTMNRIATYMMLSIALFGVLVVGFVPVLVFTVWKTLNGDSFNRELKIADAAQFLAADKLVKNSEQPTSKR
ncbi:MAG TPA: hypothetical protein V6C86_05795 [Oculatellaceae cyanobacterium]